MDNHQLKDLLVDLDIPSFITQAETASFACEIASEVSADIQQPNPERLPRLGFVYESQGIVAYQRWLTKPNDVECQKEVRELFENALSCWRALILLYNSGDKLVSKNAISKQGTLLAESELTGEPLRADLILAFRLAVSGLITRRTAETRLELKRFTPSATDTLMTWRDQVVENTFTAFVLLVRKSNGWDDIYDALARIDELRKLQKKYEDTYLGKQGDQSKQAYAALELVGLYHLAQLVTLIGEYLRDGGNPITRVRLQLDRHYEKAIDAFQSSKATLWVHLAELLWAGCRELAQNAIWSHIDGLGEATKNFAHLLASKGRPKPVLELWPSQQDALNKGLMDPYRRAIIVEMPTSAGKTLLAKFSIVQAKALNPSGTIAYIVPTRALVNQISLELRQDFRGLSNPRMVVEQAVPAFELDPTEDRLLSKKPDILVTTPEKLSLLVRSDHPAVKDLTLVIADEAHNIGDKNRGSHLELLLGTLKRDRAGIRFLLLSPFLPNGDELVMWLGENRALPPISMDWKPGRKLVGTVGSKGRGTKRRLVFETLPASSNMDIRDGLEIVIGPAGTTRPTTISGIIHATVAALANRGTILVLCPGRLSAMSRAKELAEFLPPTSLSQELEVVCRYLDAEAGRKSALAQYLRHGVAFHHSGLSHEARWLIERLISKGLVNVVCGTTTLAQGMNFPIATVIINTLKKGDEPLTYQDFWNIAGRAGRAMMDTVGIVSFPARNQGDRLRSKEFLRGEAQAISSQLATLIDEAQQIAEEFNFSIEALRNWPQLSSLLQFLAHAMRIAGSADIADEVEDLMRASLVYYQAQRQGPETSRRLIQLCRSYLFKIRGQRNILGLADQTGFATPSVMKLLYARQDPELANPENWQPERLFGNDLQPMTERIKAIADLPEIELGQGVEPPFNPSLVAAILRDWVRGDTLDTLANNYWLHAEADPDKKIIEFSNYLFSNLIGKASWGIGALETISLAGQELIQKESIGYIPSMIFFGVQQKQAIWLRMIGVPRIVANQLGRLWQKKSLPEPSEYDDIRKWVTDLTKNEWRQAIPAGSALTPDDMLLLWKELAG